MISNLNNTKSSCNNRLVDIGKKIQSNVFLLIITAVAIIAISLLVSKHYFPSMGQFCVSFSLVN